MKVYEATNSYMGFGHVRCYVYAKNHEEALRLAKEEFKRDGQGTHEDKYWENVELHLLMELEVGQPFCTEISD